MTNTRDSLIMVGCDLHEKTMLLMVAEGREDPERSSFSNTSQGRARMTRRLRKRSQSSGSAKVVFAYEARHLGFGLHDELRENGIDCYVLAPTLMSKSQKQRKSKTDEKDAKRVLGYLRAHFLAGEELPCIWIPDHQTRDDRQLVRMRLEVATNAAEIKTQIQSHLKVNGIQNPKDLGHSWTTAHRKWLQNLVKRSNDQLQGGARYTLGSLLRQLSATEREVKRLDGELVRLAQMPRYEKPVEELLKLKGVGLLTALVFLTELGDMSRFSNRRQVGAYLGLAPSSDESGDVDDRKGHITHQGPARVRKVLCQASWARSWCDAKAMTTFERITKGNPKRKKVALVAYMRRLAIMMWHRALEAQQLAGSFAEPSTTAPN